MPMLAAIESSILRSKRGAQICSSGDSFSLLSRATKAATVEGVRCAFHLRESEVLQHRLCEVVAVHRDQRDLMPVCCEPGGELFGVRRLARRRRPGDPEDLPPSLCRQLDGTDISGGRVQDLHPRILSEVTVRPDQNLVAGPWPEATRRRASDSRSPETSGRESRLLDYSSGGGGSSAPSRSSRAAQSIRVSRE